MEIVLVNLGVFQTYIKEAIQNLKLFGNNNITVIADSNLKNRFSDISGIQIIDTSELDLQEFEDKTQLDDSFRDGFWKNTSKRLFCLHQYMKKYGRRNCVHLENDIMVYANLSTLFADKKKLWMVLESEGRAVPGILFVPDHSYLDNLVANYIHNRSDMGNMAVFFWNNREQCKTLPIIKKNAHYDHFDVYSRHFETFGCLFDGAAMGQYLGGVDTRNADGPRRRKVLKFLGIFNLDNYRFLHCDTRGIVSETCVVDYSNYRFGWMKVDGRYVPHIQIENEWIPIVNLHIHCKLLKDFKGDDPTETKLIPNLN